MSKEKTVWKAKPFIWLAVSLPIFIAVIFIASALLTESWTHSSSPVNSSPTGPQDDSRWEANVPQLQLNGRDDLAQLQAKEYDRLHSQYRFKDQPGFASIPIETAMTLLEQEAHQSNQLLTPAKPATTIDLQNQKSKETQLKP